MSTWTETWKAANKPYIDSHKDVKSVLEKRKLGEDGFLRAVALVNGTFEVRREDVKGKIVKKDSYPTGAKCVAAYREMRNKAVPTFKGKVEPKKATPKAKKPAPKK